MAWTERYISVAGGGAHDGTSEANAWTLAEAIAAPYAAGQRINWKAGTYANTTTDRIFGVAGTTTAPIWHRGYNSTIGDLDADFTTAKPAITFTTGGFLATAAHQWFSNLDISGARIGPQVSCAGGNLRFTRVRVENTAANAASSAVSVNTSNDTDLLNSWFKATATATRTVLSNVNMKMFGSVITGGGIGLDLTAGVLAITGFNVFDNNGSYGILANTGNHRLIVLNSNFYSSGGDGIRMSAIPVFSIIANSIFDSCAGYGINNSSGANTNFITRFNNAFYNNTSGEENGFGDSPNFFHVTESASPFTNAGAGDFSLLSTALSKATGMPGLFENQTYTSYLDIGAVQSWLKRARAQGHLGI